MPEKFHLKSICISTALLVLKILTVVSISLGEGDERKLGGGAYINEGEGWLGKS